MRMCIDCRGHNGITIKNQYICILAMYLIYYKSTRNMGIIEIGFEELVCIDGLPFLLDEILCILKIL